jgi:hypothetical protein
MSGSVVVRTSEELRQQYQELLADVGMSFEELDERAKDYVLTPEQRSIWETLRTIRFLLGDG